MIIGTGIDLSSLERIGNVLERSGERFLERILTDKEKMQMPRQGRRRTEWTAGRFAAKEAAAKALGTGIAEGIRMKDIEVLTSPGGGPRIILHGQAEARALAMGASRIHVSISHEKETACAVVILENNAGGE